MKILKILSQNTIYTNLRSILFYRRPKKKKDASTVIFLVTRPSVWNSVKSIYETVVKKGVYTPCLVAIPPKKNGKMDLQGKETYDFCCSIDSKNTVAGYDCERGEWFDLSKREPRAIICMIPYEEEYPECYCFERLRDISTLCYVSYGYTMKAGDMQKVTVRPAVMKYIHNIFACNDIMYQYYHKRIALSEVFGRRVYNVGFPRFDEYEGYKRVLPRDNMTILWLPRWTTDQDVNSDSNEPSTFTLLKDKVVKFAKDNQNIKLITRPHPKAFENYIRRGTYTSEEITEYMAEYENCDRLSMDLSPNYFNSLVDADVLIADFTSLIAEYFVLNRPIIYFGNVITDPPIHKEMFQSFYHVTSWDEAEKVLIQLQNGNDVKKAQRDVAVSAFLKGRSDKAGERIYRIVIGE